MAFLCPVRIRRGKKKKAYNTSDIEKELNRPNNIGLNHGMGRITGSASIETLVRVGIEKEHGLSPDSKMVVLHDFTPCVDDELEVKRGQIVNILYRENDWVYVIGQDSRQEGMCSICPCPFESKQQIVQEGFIPHSYCAPVNTQLAEMAIKKKLPRDQSLGTTTDLLDGDIPIENCDDNVSGLMGLQSSLKHSQASLNSEPDFLPFASSFAKDPSGRYIVLYTFIARDENDVSVERGEFVTVLNREDPEWFWIVRSDGQEGFIPSGFVYPVYPADSALRGSSKSPLNTVQNATGTSPTNNSTNANQTNNNVLTNNNINALSQLAMVSSDDLRYHGTELVLLYDYKAQAPDDLSVKRGDWIYADLNTQTVDGWLWAYAPKTRKYGFIPKAYARPPAMTSL
ncbi:SH3 domain-containing protein Dlish [Pseudolycoriella hygida]|uniref:SH3 domain-containing protein Dlish n=1 Tax=Pseudolycoriella hygida TaxID=35572 RepID=A0A9Q0N2C0_9DIPT|nr:SH3 domain-containing protein Dlish [Pseudolycoriella hygida]